MAKKPVKTVKPSKPPGIYFRPDPDTDASLRRFIARQPVEPTAGAVALAALRHFLQSQGDYPPPTKPAS